MTKQHVNQGWIDKLDTHKDKSNDGDIGDDNDGNGHLYYTNN